MLGLISFRFTKFSGYIIQGTGSSVNLGEVNDWNGWNGADFYFEGVKIKGGIENKF